MSREILQRRLPSEQINQMVADLISQHSIELNREKRDFLAFAISQLSVRADSRAIEIMLMLPRSELAENQSVFAFIAAEPLTPEVWRRLCDIMLIALPNPL